MEFYLTETIIESLEEDAIHPEEEGFMRGYLEAYIS